MEEIEVKIIEIDKNKVINKLKELGAVKVFEGDVNSIFLDNNNELKNSGRMLRIRQKGDKFIITLKVKKQSEDVKINEEFETEIKDFNAIKTIFSNLGFKETSSTFKKRESYKLKNSLVEIDEYLKIPAFLEVESPNKEELKEIVELLGFSMNQAKTWSGKKLLDFYENQRKH